MAGIQIKKLLFGLVLSALLLTASSLWAWETKDAVEYRGTTGEEITVAWDDSPSLCPLALFQIKIYNPERDVYVWISKEIPRDTFEWTYTHPLTGHWVAMIRVQQKCEEPYVSPTAEQCVGHNGEDDQLEGYEYSKWNRSDEPEGSEVDGKQRAWWVSVWLAPPGPLSLSNDFNRENH